MYVNSSFNSVLFGGGNTSEIQTYEPLFTDTSMWMNIIIGPSKSGKFTLTRRWLLEWKRKNRLCKLVIVSSKHTERSKQFTDMNKFISKPTLPVCTDHTVRIDSDMNDQRAGEYEGKCIEQNINDVETSEAIIVNINSPDWLHDLENIVIEKARIAPLETWAVVLDNCFWQSWVLKHRVLRLIASSGARLRIGLFCLFSNIPESMNDMLKSNIDSIVALPHEASKTWAKRLETFTNGKFSVKKWDLCDHSRYEFWVCKMPTTTYTARSKIYSNVREENEFECVVPLQFRKKQDVVPYVSVQTNIEHAYVSGNDQTHNTEHTPVGITNNNAKEMVSVATWWNKVCSWVPSIPSTGLFSVW